MEGSRRRSDFESLICCRFSIDRLPSHALSVPVLPKTVCSISSAPLDMIRYYCLSCL